jgi:hypothetical protein
MLSERRDDFRTVLQGLAEALDISDSQYEAAIRHYEAVGEWLNREDSAIAVYEPEIYSQGSFRLGTMIKPINDADEYDIDLVCELKGLRKDRLTQKQLKHMVGDRLKENKNYARMLDKEGQRCWRLNYADSTSFHMDILPSVPDPEDLRILLERAGYSGILCTDRAIAITDTSLPSYDQPDPRWPRSNPVGYAEWFKERMRIQYNAKRMLLAESLHEAVQEVPDYKVKTPLQRSIQILKRQRDIMFSEDQDDHPISIIISTLAARSYNNEADLLDALHNIVNGMPRYIENRDGMSWVSNPVNPLENFADKWQQYPQREFKFRQWLQQVQTDLNAALETKDLHDMTENLKPHFGDRVINEAVSRAFRTPCASASAVASVAPRITITNASKPWGCDCCPTSKKH